MNFWRHSLHAGKEDAFFRENAHIWRAGSNEIVALAISEYGREDLFIEVHPSWHSAYPSILDWVESTWGSDREDAQVHLLADDTAKIEQLVSRGYRFVAHRENKRTFDLTKIVLDYKLERGFSIQTLAESGDLAGRVALVRSAFNNPNYTMERLQGLIASPEHRDEYNLMVVSPDGQPVAYCMGWHESARAGHGFIEPVGTHADFRRRGFATAVIKECLARLKSNGIHLVEIGSNAEPDPANALYESLLPATKQEVHTYGRGRSIGNDHLQHRN